MKKLEKIIGILRKFDPIASTVTFFASLVTIYLLIVYVINPPATKEDIMIINKSVIEEFGEIKNLIFENQCVDYEFPRPEGGIIFIGKCSSLYRQINLLDKGYAIGIKFLSKWFDEGERSNIHYLLDIGNTKREGSRISIFVENNLIKYRISTENEEYILKQNLKNVKWNDYKLSDNWNEIEIGWDMRSGYIFLDVNGKKISNVVNFSKLNLANVTLFLGSDISKQNQAEGYFDYIFIRKYIFPEPLIHIRKWGETTSSD